MTSINDTIASMAAKNPFVGNAIAHANKQSQILSSLSGSSASVTLQSVLASAKTQSVGSIAVLPTLTGASAISNPVNKTSSAAMSSITADFKGNSAILVADSHSLQSSRLLSSLTGLGGTFSATA
ncbi:MAG: hypothetical protein ABIY70_00670 [Capsulimonas sp.]|uniref:hypothetical protein n=1 Tax=Capsulimonas sp. TaxID=2494211 RepID=UPI0032664287